MIAVYVFTVLAHNTKEHCYGCRVRVHGIGSQYKRALLWLLCSRYWLTIQKRIVMVAVFTIILAHFKKSIVMIAVFTVLPHNTKERCCDCSVHGIVSQSK